MKINWKKKLTSRKFWMAVAAFVVGLILTFKSGGTTETITGCVMSLGAVIAYLVGEGLADSEKKDDNSDN